MSLPLGEPPEMEEFVRRAEKGMSYLNLEYVGNESKTYYLEGEKDGFDIRVEFDRPTREERERRGAVDTIVEEVWRGMEYRIIIDGEAVADKEYTFDYMFNSNITWDKQLSRFIMTVSGAINGHISRSKD